MFKCILMAGQSKIHVHGHVCHVNTHSDVMCEAVKGTADVMLFNGRTFDWHYHNITL